MCIVPPRCLDSFLISHHGHYVGHEFITVALRSGLNCGFVFSKRCHAASAPFGSPLPCSLIMPRSKSAFASSGQRPGLDLTA